METTKRVFKRLFLAKNYPIGSEERNRYNLSSETSEYGTSHKYGAEWTDKYGFSSRMTYRTKREAEEA